MSKPKLTPWFDGTKYKPARVGVYMLKCGGIGTTVGYQRWDGKAWGIWSLSPSIAAASAHYADERYQNDKWRGLAQKP